MLWHINGVLVLSISVCFVCSFWIIGWPVGFFGFEQSTTEGFVPAERRRVLWEGLYRV
jgi:hypothetical protein